uniref:Uncharacterized protein n=1 Tax=Dromaius novaehollandiae TaxID=8790 RepID=A0A8C4J8U4_DRONO
MQAVLVQTGTSPLLEEGRRQLLKAECPLCNCVFVGYWKPLAERSPECLVLSSDSEHSAPAEEG